MWLLHSFKNLKEGKTSIIRQNFHFSFCLNNISNYYIPQETNLNESFLPALSYLVIEQRAAIPSQQCLVDT